MSSRIESETAQPRPPAPETLHAQEVLLWKARARQNQAEARAHRAERDLWQRKAEDSHRQVMGMKTAHRERLAQVEALRSENAELRAQLEADQ